MIIIGLGATITAMAIAHVALNNRERKTNAAHSKEIKELLVEQISSSNNFAKVIENLTETVERNNEIISSFLKKKV